MSAEDRDLLGLEVANLYYTTLDTNPWLMPLLYAPQCKRSFNGLALGPETVIDLTLDTV